MGHFNITSIKNKFKLHSSLIGGKIDILLIRETKLDVIFPANQFSFKDIQPYTDWIEKIKV